MMSVMSVKSHYQVFLPPLAGADALCEEILGRGPVTGRSKEGLKIWKWIFTDITATTAAGRRPPHPENPAFPPFRPAPRLPRLAGFTAGSCLVSRRQSSICETRGDDE
jgi:hypothetical protein